MYVYVHTCIFPVQLEPHMDEALITNMYAQFGYQVLSVKMIRNHQTGYVYLYCCIQQLNKIKLKNKYPYNCLVITVC